MDTAIGSPLKPSPRLLRLTALAAVLLVGADVAVVAFGQYLGLDYSFRFTLALCGALFCGFVAGAEPAVGGAAFGFRVTPRQGWLFWIRAAIIVGAILLVILVCAGIGFVRLGYNLPEPRLKSPSEIWPLFVWMCITAPLFEEVIYRLVFCPPCTAWLGARWCILLDGVLFAGLHFLYGTPSPENLLGGFILSWAFLKSETLIVPLLLHAGGNVFAFSWHVAYFYGWHVA